MLNHYVMGDVNILGQYESIDLEMRVAMRTSDRGSSYEREGELLNRYSENDN